MARRKYGPEQIIAYLREAEVLLSLSRVVPAAVPNPQLGAFWMPYPIGAS